MLRRGRERIGDLVGAFAHHADGVNLWMPVVSERSALVQLAAAGIRVAAGTPFLAAAANGADAAGGIRSRPASEFVRVTVGMVREGTDEVADALATAAQHLVAGGY